MKSNFFLNFITIVILSVSANVSKAEALSSDDLFHLSLEELLTVEITGATLLPSTLKEVPAAITVITKAQINLYGFSKLTSLLNYVSGYQVQRSDANSFAQTVSSRSLKASGSAREILLLLDGQRLNNDWLGGAPHLLSNFPLAHVKRVEVIKGAGSALYGSNAYAGVINIITEMTNQASLSIGFNESTRLNGQFNKTFEEVNLSGFASIEDSQGEQVSIYDPFIADYQDTTDPYQAKSFYLKARWQDFEVNIRHQKNESEQFYTVGFVSGDDNYFAMKQQSIRVKHQIDLNEHWLLKTQLFISKHQLNISGKIIPAPAETFIKGRVDEQDKGIELSMSYSASTEEKILFGFEYRKPKLTNTDANTRGALNLYLPQAPTNGRIIKGAFFQYQNTITKDLGYILGIRQDDYSDFGSHLSPRAGINWQLNTKQVVKFLYGHSFRAPSRSETDVMNSSAIVASPDLQPEVFTTYDVIWQYSSDVSLLSVNLFYNNVEDAIRPLQTSPIIYSNEGSGNSTGIELEFLHAFNDKWQVRMNLMKLSDYDKEFYTDPNLAAGLILSYAGINASYSLLANYQSSRIDDNSSVRSFSKLPARTKVEAHAKWALTEQLNLSFNISNLLDSKSYGTAYRSEIIGGVQERGRLVNITLKWKF
jgi:outer membrane cobalamin receptor